jgi:monoamine oxidase
MAEHVEVGIVGAGAAGLAAARELTGAGVRIRCLEASPRMGGRIYTVHDPASPLPVELGAEFVHGRAPEIWDSIWQDHLAVSELTPRSVYLEGGRVREESEIGVAAGNLLPNAPQEKQAGDRDESFAAYLARSGRPPLARKLAARYVEGFNAARQERISMASLLEDEAASERIEGHRTFRLSSGYDSLIQSLARPVESRILCNARVDGVSWGPHGCTVEFRQESTRQTLHCAKLIVTLPLGVLQSGAVEFDPQPGVALQSAQALAFGQAYRVTFRFPEAFWERERELAGAAFLFSSEHVFSTWWTTRPVASAVLTGWCAGSAADPLRRLSDDAVVAEALGSLGRMLNRRIPDPERAYFWNWQSDPLICGGYSYVPVGALPARRKLAEPVESTLFFAGEATDTTGYTGTVHGAIASGHRAARQVVAALGR